MALRLDDKWIWDFWFARDGEDHHVYFLQADRSLGDPEQRHWSVSIGHAVSRDLISWEVLGTCLTPSPSPAWDDCTTWTGSVKRHPDGYWCLYYTGTSRADNGLRQRIGMATSRDLHNWEKHDGNPILCVDPAHYETLNTELWHDQAWRDPWVIPDPDGTHYHMFFTARTNHGSGDARGCIGHAVSNDLHTWESRPPVWAGELYGELEVPQVVNIEGTWYLIFCTAKHHFTEAYRTSGRAHPVTGTHYLMADSPTGPWRLPGDRFLVGDDVGRIYSGKLHQANDGRWYFFGFLNYDAQGRFIGELTDPLPVHRLEDGRLRVDASRYGIPNNDEAPAEVPVRSNACN